MTILSTPLPPRQAVYLYLVVDASATPPAPVAVALSRREARELIRWRKDADVLRIRRARAVIYDR